MEVDVDKVKVRRWSFCPKCQGRKELYEGEPCPECNGIGTVVEEVLLSEIPVTCRKEYIVAQEDFINEQLV